MRRTVSSAFLALLLVDTAAALDGKPVNSKCPVKTDIPSKSDITSSYKGLVIGFCCQDCKGKFSANPDVYAENLPLQSWQQKPITRPLYEDVMSDLAGMSVLTGHFALTGLPAWAVAVATRSIARKPAATNRLMRSPPTILTLRPPGAPRFDHFFSPPWGGVP